MILFFLSLETALLFEHLCAPRDMALKSHTSQTALLSQAFVPGLARDDLAGQADQPAPPTHLTQAAVAEHLAQSPQQEQR